MEVHGTEVECGKRFEFGANWAKFLDGLSEDRVLAAEGSLRSALEVKSLDGMSFLDAGSGSGLFSLAARRLGARVYSFDYDPQSVSCADYLKHLYCPKDPEWKIEEGSILDAEYLSGLGSFDVVYSWGVLHHTGDLRRALENVVPLVAVGGKLYISIYNDQGRWSRLWLKVKKLYNWLPSFLRWLVLVPAFLRLWGPAIVRDAVRGHPFHTWIHYSQNNMRGMSPGRDLIDWVGGLPFEVSTPECIFDFFAKRGFQLIGLATRGGGHGCNEFIFRRIPMR